jgi:DtxR family transcriptional regulator, Mn-dependent transcriptional regulator
MALTASMEDYLEAILRLADEKRVVRVRDVAKAVGVSAPSATGAIKTLQKLGLVAHERYEDVLLTRQGKRIAGGVDQRHRELRAFFEGVLLLDAEVAEEEACRLEHSISPGTLDRLRQFLGCIEDCSRAQRDCIRRYRAVVEESGVAAAAHAAAVPAPAAPVMR